ncbi:MAG: hypothetical protein RLZZ137_1830 [Cyanobacteriota bacterium]|jgi:hypothetical protein
MNVAFIGCKLFKPHQQPRGSDRTLAGSLQAKTSAVDLQANDAFQSASNASRRTPGIRVNRGTAAEQVLAAELSGRQENGDALAMMVSSMVHMVQAGKTRSTGSRWSA